MIKLLPPLLTLLLLICGLKSTLTANNPNPNYCENVTVTGGSEITITGVNAPWHRIEFKRSGDTEYIELCNDNCNSPDNISGLSDGFYIVKVDQGDQGGGNYCRKTFTVLVSNPPPMDHCAGVSVLTGAGSITISGVDASWNRIQYRLKGSTVYSDICNDNCSNPQVVNGLAAGRYVIKVEQSSGGDQDYCSLEIEKEVVGAAIDYCADVSVMGGEGEIMIMGVDAPWHRIQYRLEGSNTYSEICNDNCDNPHIVTGLSAGLYIIRVDQSGGGDMDYCTIEIAAVVTSSAIDYCADVSVMGGEGEIMIMGVDAPWHRIQYRLDGSTVYSEICNDNCNNPHLVTGLTEGLYIIRVEQSNNDGSNFCYREIAAEVTSKGLCGNVRVIVGKGKFTITGIVGSWNHVQILAPSGRQFMSVCNDNCSDPVVIDGLVDGTYFLFIEQSNGDDRDYCKIEKRVVAVNQVTTGADSRAKEFTSFNAFAFQRTVNLEWVTNTTFKSVYYIVEKSEDGTHFEPIDQVANIFDGNNLAYFESIDEAPILGTNYYRLKQVFQDGSSEYSAVRAIQFGFDLSAIEVFPNPAQDKLSINLSEFAGKKANLIITNQFGQVVTEQQFEALPSDLLQIDVSDYTNGLYLIRTKIDRTKLKTEKFMVGKMY